MGDVIIYINVEEKRKKNTKVINDTVRIVTISYRACVNFYISFDNTSQCTRNVNKGKRKENVNRRQNFVLTAGRFRSSISFSRPKRGNARKVAFFFFNFSTMTCFRTANE